MTYADLFVVNRDGGHFLTWRIIGGTTNTFSVDYTLDKNAASGWVNIVSGVASADNYNAAFTNDTTIPRWFRVRENGGTTLTTVDYSYATNTEFYAPDGWYQFFLGAGSNIWFQAPAGATPAGSNANPDTPNSQTAPKLSWADGGGNGIHHAGNWAMGDWVCYKRGETYTTRAVDAGGGTPLVVDQTWPAGKRSMFCAYGPWSTARPKFTDTDVQTVFNIRHNGTASLLGWAHLAFDQDMPSRGQTDGPFGIDCRPNSARAGISGGSVIVVGNYFKRLYWAWDIEGYDNSSSVDGRMNMFVANRNMCERIHGNDVDTVIQNPSAFLVSQADNVTLRGNVQYHCGYDETAGDMPLGSGTASAVGTGTPGTLSIAGTPWTVNAYQNRHVWVTHGGVTYNMAIASNTNNTLTLYNAWSYDGGPNPSIGDAFHIPYSSPSINRHSFYAQFTCSNVSCEDNINSHADIQMRSGGTYLRCLSILAPTAFQMGTYYTRWSGDTPQITTMSLIDCVVDGSKSGPLAGGTQIGSGGNAMDLGNGGGTANGALLISRCISNLNRMEGLGTNSGQCLLKQDNGQNTGSITLIDNVVINPQKGFYFEHINRCNAGFSALRNVVHVTSNYFGQQCCFGTNDATWAPSGGQTNGSNSCFSINAGGSASAGYINGSVSFATLMTAMSDGTSTYLGSAPAWTQERRITHYSTYLGGAGTTDDFLTKCVANRLGSWDERYTAAPAISYIRAGYVNLVSALTTVSVPFVPTIGVTSSPTSSSLNIAWTDVYAFDETGFDSAYSTTGAEGAYTTFSNIGGVDAVSGTNSGLSPSTLYYIKVRSKNAVGNSLWSDPATGTTSASSGQSGYQKQQWLARTRDGGAIGRI